MTKKNDIFVNLFWKMAERMSAQVITVIVSIVLARILDPEHYGIVAMVMIFVSLANVFVSDCMTSALIQKKDADQLDFSSALYFNLAFSVVLYMLLFFLAPWISRIYGEGYEILTPVLRVMGIRLIPTAINAIQWAYIAQKMIFRKFFLATLTGTVLASAVGIMMAYAGYGVWALAFQYVIELTAATIFLIFSLGNIYSFQFSFGRLKSILKFGSDMLVSNLMVTGYQQIRTMIIGKLYSSEELAFYEKGQTFPNLLVTNIDTSIGTVLFPKMSSEQNDISKIKATARNSIRFSSFFMSPLVLGLMAVAAPLVRVLLTEKWAPSIPMLQLFCVFYLFQPIHTANMQAIKAVGRSDIYLKLETAKKIVELVVLFITMRMNVLMILVGMVACNTLFTLFNAYPNTKLIHYGIGEQFLDILPSLLMSLVMFAVVWMIQMFHLGDLTTLILQVCTGCLVYIGLSAVTGNQEFRSLLAMIRKHRT